MMLTIALLALTSCSEPDPKEGDTGALPTADAGTADGGSTSTEELCREETSAYDADLKPRRYYDLYMFVYDHIVLSEIHWDTALDGAALSIAPMLGVSSTTGPVLVDWVADGSAEAIYPCMDGPALRLGVRAAISVDEGQAAGVLIGYADGNAEEMWLNRVRAVGSDVTLASDWQALVDTELDAAGRPDAELVMELTTSTTEQTRLTIGSEDGAWYQTWWSGPMESGNKIPTSLPLD